MSRMGKIIKSAKIKLTTPPKLIPPLHKTAAKGTLPTEQTKLTIATNGPTSGPSILAIVGLLEKKNAFQNELGTHAANAPAMSSPSTISTHTDAQSITKKLLTAVNPLRLNSREKNEPPETLISIAACPSILPVNPFSACALAICTSFGVKVKRKITAMKITIKIPPTNSAAMNGHPIRTIRIMPSSITRLVEASSKTIAEVKLAPFRKMERASATAAYEQELEAIPNSVARVRFFGELPPSAFAIA